MRRFITASILGALIAAGALASSPENEEERQARADCRVEGEAAGLSGSELDEFTESCVEELLGAELVNVVK